MQIRQLSARAFIIILLTSVVWGQHPDAVGRRGMVVSGNEVASRIGLNILRRGGNAVDAAIATGFALAVVQPRAGNIGGGGFMILRLADGQTTTLDFREKAPGRATRNMYVSEHGEVIENASTEGILASGVPGTVSGFGLAFERYGSGRMTWSDLLAPAIELAGQGFAVSYQLHNDLVVREEKLTRFEETRRIFYPNGEPLRLNALFKQTELAATLTRIATQGSREFYVGETARLLAEHMRRRGGMITMDDLAAYETVERPPVEFTYRDVRIISMGPPSSGGIVLAQIFNLLELGDFSKIEFHSAEHIHSMVEAERRAYADRFHYLGDVDYVTVPINKLISKSYAARRWGDFSPKWATSSNSLDHGNVRMLIESGETTHYSITDRWGNAVAVTTTINDLYGSGEVVAGAGYFLNDEMDDFTLQPGQPDEDGIVGSHANAIEQGKRMLSSMTPTIVTRNDTLLLVLGSPGGKRIITTVAQVVSNIVDFNFSVKGAVEVPRFHHQWKPDEILAERLAISPETRTRLARMGHKVRYTEGSIGIVQCIYVDPVSGWYFGAADSRGASGAAGY
ncbi:gamma-glutamyltransferase [Candidatus Neomarinimicrobiota bacterium]